MNETTAAIFETIVVTFAANFLQQQQNLELIIMQGTKITDLIVCIVL